MAVYGTETVPSSWDDDRDTAFFRIITPLFTSEFNFGASVLLASYDEEREAARQSADLPVGNTGIRTPSVQRSAAR